jgi:putative ABC transport system permease protein
MIDLSLEKLAILYAMLLLPIGLIYRYSPTILKSTIISIIRMSVQLFFIGFYLKYIFAFNSVWLNMLWIVIMVIAANTTITRQAGLTNRYMFLPTLFGLVLSTLLMSGVLILLVVQPTPYYDARYLIPLTGMILGNSLRSNVLALEQFYSEIREKKEAFIGYLMMGATLSEAIKPFLSQAMKTALNPFIATMTTIGLVSLPGMMTGQILGGTFPLVAVKYQIAIVICIFCSMSLTAYLNIRFSMKAAFNDYNMLNERIFIDAK